MQGGMLDRSQTVSMSNTIAACKLVYSEEEFKDVFIFENSRMDTSNRITFVR
jgi:hypothetical protein